ncbi:hypothetical protein AAVH_26921 [Aphelenchoides avenae]|nr:hypothetical protein AAVH_26921 [Aphelenchus avenae]
MEHPESNLADFANRTLVQPDAESGLKTLEYHRIDGFTHTNAKNTVEKSDGSAPITVEQYYKDFEEELRHPELPLLALRTGPLLGGELWYDYVPLERVFFRDLKKEFGTDGWNAGGWSSEDDDEGVTGFENERRQATDKQRPVRLHFTTMNIDDGPKPDAAQSGPPELVIKQAPAGRGMFMGRGGTRPSIPRK